MTNGVKWTSNLVDEFLHTRSELAVTKQEHLNNEETHLGVVTLDTAQ